jgi:hypothetical protein
VKRIIRAILLAPILAYQRFISPALPRRCKYYPTCSEYAVDAIREVGIFRGTVLAAWRLLRCNPWSHGGYDPVEDRTLFPVARETPPTDTSSPDTGSRPQPRESGRGSERARLPVVGSASERKRSISRA